MKALITAFALLSFVAATSMPSVARAADTTQTQQSTATTHVKKPAVKKASAKKKSTKKIAPKKKTPAA